MINEDSTTPAPSVNTLSLLKAALYYSQFARVFPLQPNSKMPLLPGSWTTYASQDPIRIMQWWTQHPDANIAVVADQNLTIIDLDIKDGKDGIKSLRELFSELDLDIQDIPSPVTTASGGKHVFYTHPTGRKIAFHNSTNKGNFGGVDVRSGNAYVVAAPSVVGGADYRWAENNGASPLGNIPELPSALADALDRWSTDNIIDISTDQPDLLEEPPALTDHPCINLPQPLQEFALHGDASNYGGDGSAALMGLASRLYILGLGDSEVLSFLAYYPGPSNVAFKRRNGSFESAVSWLWKYSCIKARKNRKMDQEDVMNTFLPTTTNQVPLPSTANSPSLNEIESIEDFSIAREYLRAAAQLPPLEQAESVTKLKTKLKTMGISSRAIDQELKLQETALRAEGASQMGGPVFAHMSESGAIRATTHNFMSVMQYQSIGIQHNKMSHDYDILIPDSKWLIDTQANDQRTYLRDMLEQYGMPSARIDEYISLVGGQNAYHPIEDMMANTTWDGVDRLTPVLETLELSYGDVAMRDKLVTTWLVSAIKVVEGYGNNPPRGVLVLAGPQYSGKTSFFRLITPMFTFGEGLHLDVHDKDSLKKAVKYWIVELGELDATFKKSDIAALKAHISNTEDEIRLPYAAKESKWPRRTVYGATVNRVDFLQDYTGNTRFWPIEVSSVDIQTLSELMGNGGQAQFWAQIKKLLDQGHPYLLNQKEIVALEQHNDSFREIKMEEEMLHDAFDWDKTCTVWMTTAEIAGHCGMRGEVKGRNPLTEPLQKLTGMARAIHKKRNGTLNRCWKMPPLRVTTVMGEG